MGSVKKIVENRYPSSFLINLYSLLSFRWQANNVDGFLESTNCYKIHCCD
jgi:hypothetical protein